GLARASSTAGCWLKRLTSCSKKAVSRRRSGNLKRRRPGRTCSTVTGCMSTSLREKCRPGPNGNAPALGWFRELRRAGLLPIRSAGQLWARQHGAGAVINPAKNSGRSRLEYANKIEEARRMLYGDQLHFVHCLPRRTRLKVPQRRRDHAF